MIISLPHNHYDKGHLIAVMTEMEKLGAPSIRVYDTGVDGIYQAIEGTHRLRACESLGISPIISVLDENTLISDLDLDIDYIDGMMIGEIGDWENHKISFE